jgi:hypothetical protein
MNEKKNIPMAQTMRIASSGLALVIFALIIIVQRPHHCPVLFCRCHATMMWWCWYIGYACH